LGTPRLGRVDADHWDCLVDLWTAEEGCSDLALELEVRERGSRFEFRVIMIYVP
jgi:hypothetical protein